MGGDHDDAGGGGVVHGEVGDDLHPARDADRLRTVGHGEETEGHLFVVVGSEALHVTVLEYLPGAREIGPRSGIEPRPIGLGPDAKMRSCRVLS